MQDLKGKVVLITGAARGMGKQHAATFVREGARVVMADIDEDRLACAAADIGGAACGVSFHGLDISDRNACLELVKKVEAEMGSIDVLVNNAAVAENEEVLGQSERSLRRTVEVNLLGQVWMMQAVVPGMVRRGGGHVVNVCSVAGKVGVPRLGAYCATKHALIGLTDTMRQELKKTGVRFIIVNPGYTNTGMFAGAKAPVIQPWQDPRRVSDAMVAAIKKNRAEIFVPRFAGRMTALLRGLGLPRLMDLVCAVSGLNRSFATMEKERGRPF
ncbi:MAG: SDR family NAD(P)-dependent oxidoreductase [Actinomycetota bacterium]